MLSLIRQVMLMIIGVLLLALVGSVVTHTLMARQSLLAQLQVRNDDGALALALALSQQSGDTERMRLVAAAQFDTGHYHRLRVLRSDGQTLVDLDRPLQPGQAPAWFARLLPVDVSPGVAPVSDGWRPVGSVQLSSQANWATDALWSGCLRMAGWLSVLGLLAAALAVLAVQAWRRPLDAAVAQAQALEEGRFVLVAEPRVPELRRLTRSMNSLVRRLQGVFEAQALQLTALRSQAHLDPATGLLNRRQVIAQLGAALGAERHRGAGLLLVRLRHLEAMNRRIGHEAADRLLAALAQVLQSYPRSVKGALAGRLNGCDFVLYLPAAGMAAETARSLLDALRTGLSAIDLGAELAIGGIELPHAAEAAEALALADRALAQAETLGPFGLHILPAARTGPAVRGQQQWQALLGEALATQRVELAEYAVRGPSGALLHLDCPTRLQLVADGPYEPAAQWLAMAVRCRLVASVDLAALTLALRAVRRDGRARCVNVAAASLASAGFISEVQQRLEAAPADAAHLSFDFVEGTLRLPQRVQQAASLWRRCGASVGLEHAGANLNELAELHWLGLDYVKIDGAFVQGVASVPAVRELARGLVLLLRGMGLQVLAEAVDDEDDLAVLWELGFDGATGPAVRAA